MLEKEKALLIKYKTRRFVYDKRISDLENSIHKKMDNIDITGAEKSLKMYGDSLALHRFVTPNGHLILFKGFDVRKLLGHLRVNINYIYIDNKGGSHVRDVCIVLNYNNGRQLVGEVKQFFKASFTYLKAISRQKYINTLLSRML